MRQRLAFLLIPLVAGLSGFAGAANAELRFEIKDADGTTYIRVSGDFEQSDRLDRFSRLVRENHPSYVTFDSPGGNIAKAIDLGRLIREAGLATVGRKDLECDSACAFTFMGGVERTADPESIGMHKASLENPRGLSIEDAVSTIQELTAIEIAYMSEMGVDPALLQVALTYNSDDIRYLSTSEMERYRVTTGATAPEPDQTVAEQPPPEDTAPVETRPDHTRTRTSSGNVNGTFPVPAALSGRIRDPDGSIGLRAQPDEHSRTLRVLANGTRVKILDDSGQWYRVSTPDGLGYAHESWVYVDQFQTGPFETRRIQVKTFSDYDAAAAYVHASELPLVAELSRNGSFDVTLQSSYSAAAGAAILNKLKAQGEVPDDAFVTYGNTYVRVVCCQ